MIDEAHDGREQESYGKSRLKGYVMRIMLIVVILALFVVNVSYAKQHQYTALEVDQTVQQLTALIQSQKFSEVQRKFDELLKAGPFDLDGRRVLSRVYGRIGDDKNILPALDIWCKRSDAAHSAFILRGRYHIKDAWRARGSGWSYTVSKEDRKLFYERLELAKRDLERAYRMNPADTNSASGMITVCLGSQLPEETMESWFQKAIETDPLCSDIYERKLVYLFPKWYGTAEKSTAFANYWYKRCPPGSRVYIIKAFNIEELAARSDNKGAYLKQPDVQKAIQEIFDRYLKDFPKSTYARAYLADFKKDLGEYKAAIRLCDEALNIDPRHRWSLKRRGSCYYQLREYDKAKKDYDRAVELGPNDAYAWYRRGLVEHYGFSDYQKAIKFYDKAIELNQKHKPDRDQQAWTFKARGKSYYQLKDYDKARRNYIEAVVLDPNNADTWYCLGRVEHRGFSQYQNAVEAFTKAIALKQTRKMYYYRRALAYRRLKKHSLAIDDLTKTIQLDPKYAKAYRYRGQSYWLTDEYDLARRDFDSAVRIDPKLLSKIKKFNKMNRQRKSKSR